MKFFEKLVVLRKKNNMSQEVLADKLGISRQAISKWESGLSIPDMEKMMQLCRVFDCDLEDLIDDVKVMVKHSPSFEVDLSRYRNCLDINLIYKDNYNFFSEMDYLLSSIRDKKQIIFDDYYGYEVVIKASVDNIGKLEDNYYDVYR